MRSRWCAVRLVQRLQVVARKLSQVMGVESGAPSVVGRVEVGPFVEHQGAEIVDNRLGSLEAIRLSSPCPPPVRPAPSFLSFPPVLTPPPPLHSACGASVSSLCCSSVFRGLRPVSSVSSVCRMSVSAVASHACWHSSGHGRAPPPSTASSNCLGWQSCVPIAARHSHPPGLAPVQSSKIILRRQVTVCDLGLVNSNDAGSGCSSGDAASSASVGSLAFGRCPQKLPCGLHCVLQLRSGDRACASSGGIVDDYSVAASGDSEELAGRRSPQGRRPASSSACTHDPVVACDGGSGGGGGGGTSAAVAAKEEGGEDVGGNVGLAFVYVRSGEVERNMGCFGSVEAFGCALLPKHKRHHYDTPLSPPRLPRLHPTFKFYTMLT